MLLNEGIQFVFCDFRATIISQDGQLYVNNDSEEIRYIPVSGVDPDDSKECPRIKALPFVSDSGASSDYRSGLSISSAILFLLSYMLSRDISNILFWLTNHKIKRITT